MNFQTILEELDRLYDEKVEAEEEITEEVEENAEEATLTEAAEEEVEIDDDEEIVIVDDEADEADEEAVEEVQMVLECAKCGALVIKPFAEIITDEESGLVNMEEACQYCEATEGYKVAGTLIPSPSEEVTENDEVEEPAEEVIEDEVAEDEID